MSWKQPNSTLNRPFPNKKVPMPELWLFPSLSFLCTLFNHLSHVCVKRKQIETSFWQKISQKCYVTDSKEFFWVHKKMIQCEPLSITPLDILSMEIDLMNHPPSFSFKYNSVVLHITRTPFVFCTHLFPSLTHIARGQNKNIFSPTFSLN